MNKKEEQEESYEYYEEEYEEEEEQQEVTSLSSQSSKYTFFDKHASQYFVSFKLQQKFMKLNGIIPPKSSLHITAISLSLDNTSKGTHIIKLSYDDEQVVIARLIPDRIETAQVDVVLSSAQCNEFEFLLEGSEVADVDIVGMIYSEESSDDELLAEQQEQKQAKKSNSPSPCDRRCESCPRKTVCSQAQEQPNQHAKAAKDIEDSFEEVNVDVNVVDEKKQTTQNEDDEYEEVNVEVKSSEVQQEQNTTYAKQTQKTDGKPKVNMDEIIKNGLKQAEEANNRFYEQQAKAKLMEFRMDRAINATKVEYKDSIAGSGKTAIQGSKVSILTEIRENDEKGKLIEKTEESKMVQVKLQRGQLTDGILRCLMGMREGGERNCVGPKAELLGEGQGTIWIKVQMVRVQ